MAQPRRYIVRVYRQGFRALSGVVQDAATQGERPFRDARELIELLRGSIRAVPAFRGDPHPTVDDKETP